MNPHKHAEVIKAWADGKDIEIRLTPESAWVDTTKPSWDEHFEYRVKPVGSPDKLVYAYVTSNATFMEVDPKNANAIFCFDGFTQQLIKAQLRL
jgi:hypothetical protein